MQGATIQIIYGLKITNNSDIDFFENYELSGGTVKTRAMCVYDYVANNFVFRKEDNNSLWNIVETVGYGSNEVKKTVTDNKITVLEANNDLLQLLQPGESTKTVKLVLSKVMSPESTTDDLTYENEAEIVYRYNGVGRRDHDSIPGNHSPFTPENIEPDTGIASIVIILPPFGETHISSIYYIVGAIAV